MLKNNFRSYLYTKIIFCFHILYNIIAKNGIIKLTSEVLYGKTDKKVCRKKNKNTK